VKTVFFDVDTQIDFLYPAGALYVPGAEAIVDRIAVLNRYAESQGIPLISTMDAHTENDPEFKDWPAHCVAGTAGQRKPPVTLLEKRMVVANTPNPPDILGARQILLEKQALNCFTNLNLNGLLERFGAERYVVYGVVTEVCVRFAALGLLETGRRVELVTDAVKELDSAARDRFFSEFMAKGGVLTTVDKVTGAMS
jgi:nicotinamidase/pyrazinamidase